jgi:hypothetical protein
MRLGPVGIPIVDLRCWRHPLAGLEFIDSSGVAALARGRIGQRMLTGQLGVALGEAFIRLRVCL